MTQAQDNALRQRNFDLYNRMIAAQNAKDPDGFSTSIADDILFEAPAYRENGEPIASGRQEMEEMFEGLTTTFETIDYRVKRFIPAVDPELVIAEVTGNNLVAATGKYYRNSYLFLVRCHGGRVAHILEYSNPQIHREAHAPG